ncbi:MAG TPA: hypothetical protein VHW01_21425, partial [Polyangiaceae bacterium]|nr:hypothetical protein [Polyangiaceae bacterium]
MHARAENTAVTAKTLSTKAASADSAPHSDPAAEAAYQQAQAMYAKNDIQGALDSMRESYRLCQRRELLYNLAMLERELQQCRSALDDYTSYLEQVPQGRYRSAAEQASAELSRQCPAVGAPSVAPPPPSPPVTTSSEPPPAPAPALPPAPAPAPSNTPVSQPDSPYWTPPRVIGWSAITAGLLAGSGALYFTFAAVTARSDLQRNVDAVERGAGPYDPSLQDRQHRDQTLAQVLAVSGSALVA